VAHRLVGPGGSAVEVGHLPVGMLWFRRSRLRVVFFLSGRGSLGGASFILEEWTALHVAWHQRRFLDIAEVGDGDHAHAKANLPARMPRSA
jgi:hypothetical protein